MSSFTVWTDCGLHPLCTPRAQELRQDSEEEGTAGYMGESRLGLVLPVHMSYYFTTLSWNSLALHMLMPKELCYTFFS